MSGIPAGKRSIICQSLKATSGQCSDVADWSPAASSDVAFSLTSSGSAVGLYKRVVAISNRLMKAGMKMCLGMWLLQLVLVVMMVGAVATFNNGNGLSSNSRQTDKCQNALR